MRRVADRQIELRQHFRLDGTCQFTQRGVVRRYLDGDDTLTALTLDRRRSPVLTHRSYFAQLNLGARSGRNSEVHDIRDRVTVIFLQTNDDVVLRAIVFQIAAVHTRYAVTQIR